jgi:outer membrane biosynthesis protein TonB
LALLATFGTAWPQAQPQPPNQAPTPASVPGAQEQSGPAPQPAPENPGLINEMSKLIDKITPSIKGPGETLNDLNARAKDAGDALSRLAKPGSMVSGRTICPAGADGTPNCKAAADKLCQSKGYKDGKSLNTDSAQSCSAKVLIPGRQRKPDDCRTDNFVTTALCQ